MTPKARNRELSRLRMAKMNERKKDEHPGRTSKNYSATANEHAVLKSTLDKMR